MRAPPERRDTEPPASSSRSRATSGSTPARSARARRARRFRCSECGVDAASSVRRSRARRSAAHARAASSFSGDDADHQPGVRATEPDHRHRRDRVQHELLRRPRLETRRACDRLRPDDGGDLVVGRARRARCRARRRRRRAARPSRPRLRARQRCTASSRSRSRRRRRRRRRRASDTEIGDAARRCRLPHPRRRLQPRRRPRPDASRTSDRTRLRRARRAARRPGADVDEPAAARESLRDRVDRSRERIPGFGDRVGNGRVLRVQGPTISRVVRRSSSLSRTASVGF